MFNIIEFMQTRVLRTFLKVSQVQSFATAAQELNMTVSAVSMQIKNLENQLNVQLFDRGFRPPLLTPIGRQILRNVESIVFEENKLRNMCVPQNTLAGDLELGFIMTASVRLLPRFLQKAAVHSPSASFTIRTGLSKELTDQVVSGKLDAAIVTTTEMDGNLRYDSLLNDRLVFGIPANAWSQSRRITDLNLPFLHFSPHSGVGEVIAQTVRGSIAETHQCIVLDSIEAIVECVNMGIGYTLLPEPDLIRYASDSAVAINPDTQATREISLITRIDDISANYRGILVDLLLSDEVVDGKLESIRKK